MPKWRPEKFNVHARCEAGMICHKLKIQHKLACDECEQIQEAIADAVLAALRKTGMRLDDCEVPFVMIYRKTPDGLKVSSVEYETLRRNGRLVFIPDDPAEVQA